MAKAVEPLYTVERRRYALTKALNGANLHPTARGFRIEARFSNHHS